MSNKMKITRNDVRVLQICGIEYGGIEALVFSLIKKMKKRNIDFEYFSPVPRGDSFATDITNYNVPINYIPHNKKVFQVVELYKLLKTKEYNVVHSHNLFSSGINLFIAFLARVPVRVAQAHNTKNSRKLTPLRRLYENCMRLFIRIFSTHMIAVSEEAAIYVFGKKGLDSRKTQIIRNGINLEKFKPEKYNSDSVKRELGLKLTDIHFVSVARFSVQKNHTFLIDIFEEVLKLIPNAHLTLVGGGELETEIKEKVKRKNLSEKITFLGIRNDVAKVLSGMDYFILPSLWEGFGIVYIEAQAMGLHCFASDCIPKAANAGYMDFIPLECSPIEWANKIFAVHQKKGNRKTNYILGSEYDIKTVESKLAQIYGR